MANRGRVAQIDNARKNRAAGRESAGEPREPTPREAIEQGMARQNVRIGRGHAPSDPGGEPGTAGTRFIVILIAVLLVALALWIGLV